jgi:hypothetical protein
MEGPAGAHLAGELVFLEEVGEMGWTAGIGVALREADGIVLEWADVGRAVIEVSGYEEV